eukprot:CCRYP_019803-RA/>CCRYP_019803-RA protein AED:0.47 eAED:0.47 QI:0/0/0/0.66/0.5/0.33/3/0/179
MMIFLGVLDDTEESLEEEDDNEEEHDYSSLASKVMILWKKRADSMLHNFALAGYLLSPNPTIMAHALAHQTKKHDDAVSVLISKLMLPANLVGPERATRRAEMRHQFWIEYRNFTLKLGVFADPDIWIITGNPITAALLAVYSPPTLVLEALSIIGRFSRLPNQDSVPALPQRSARRVH